MTLKILIAHMSAFREAQANESVMISLRCLFTRVRGRGILRSWYAGCRIAPLAGRPWGAEKSQADHYMLHVCTEMRSGQYATPRQDADAGEGYQDFRPRSTTRGTARLAWMCVQGDLKAVIHGEARRVDETTFFG
jgi:hypothetical protein